MMPLLVDIRISGIEFQSFCGKILIYTSPFCRRYIHDN